MKKLILIAILAASAFGLWRYSDFFKQSPAEILEKIAHSQVVEKIQELEEKISAPPPLRGPLTEQESKLTRSGVIQWTNINRSQNGSLPALKENSKLIYAAKLKVEDMFNRQYFEHISPQGTGPADLAKAAGYEYISVGENLALGNYKDDKALVEAWMNSPGHRANILNTKFTEIGVAVGQGMFEGKKVWLAVQEFGKPLSACPSIDSNLKEQISSLEADVKFIEPQIAQLKNELEAGDPKTKEEYDEYNRKVSQYNDLVKIFNNKVDALKIATEKYNAQVRAFNECAQA